MLLGFSGASFLFGALDNTYYYLLGGLFLVAGLIYLLRGQPMAVSLQARQRNRWFFPMILVASAGAAYLALTFVISPLLVSVASASMTSRAAAAPPATTPWQAALRVEGMT